MLDLEKVVLAAFLLLVSSGRVGGDEYSEVDKRCQQVARSLPLQFFIVIIYVIIKRPLGN